MAGVAYECWTTTVTVVGQSVRRVLRDATSLPGTRTFHSYPKDGSISFSQFLIPARRIPRLPPVGTWMCTPPGRACAHFAASSRLSARATVTEIQTNKKKKYWMVRERRSAIRKYNVTPLPKRHLAKTSDVQTESVVCVCFTFVWFVRQMEKSRNRHTTKKYFAST